ncbi:hypothetical protein DFH09DRAFT_988655 [Mycena vulgaris]|nr:hypothetical protein DFH09DRAFT_988655 [Mycena vulgaris]
MPQIEADVEHGKEPNKKSDPGHELGSTKLWAVYISEAEKYDKALVESWRNDMSGMLIFAGLFSGSLTAFLIESYRDLSPDPAESTVTLLKQIVGQLNGSANNPHYMIPETSIFTPPVSALLCNALWFISLTLSLTCALVATLVEQWARDFLHRADIRSAPVERARIFSYLYYGFKRFKMHSVVEVLPLLLHASLVLFFAGLVAFLAPVNTFIMILGAALLGVVLAVYMLFTILPLIHLDCPYRTPLSGTLWRAFHAVPYARSTPGISKSASRGADTGNMIVAISRRATEPSIERSARDRRALVWTVKCLADDSEFERFVESIPDVLWGPNGKRHTYDDHIKALVHSPEARLLSRISDMLRRCESGVLTSPSKNRRQIACYRAFWAISTLNDVKDAIPQMAALFEHPLIPSGSTASSEVQHYAISAIALTRWNAYCSVKVRLLRTINLLSQSQVGLSGGRASSLNFLLDFFRDMYQHSIFGSHPFHLRKLCSDSLREVDRHDPMNVAATRPLLKSFSRVFGVSIQTYLTSSFSNIFTETTKIGAAPYQFDRTREAINLEDAPLSSGALLVLEQKFNTIVSNHLDTLRTAPGFHLLDRILGILISFWPTRQSGHVSIPSGLIKYLDRRGSDGAVLHVVWQFRPDPLWSCITTALASAQLLAAGNNTLGSKVTLEESLIALGRLYSLPARIMPALPICESALEAVLHSTPSFISPSVIALVKANIVDALRTADRVSTANGDFLSSLSHPILPVDTAHKLPAVPTSGDSGGSSEDKVHDHLQTALYARITEARFEIVSELLEACNSPEVPYKIMKTLSIIKPTSPSVRIHPAHQLRFARSIDNIFRAGSGRQNSEVLEAVLHLDVFDIYAPAQGVQKLPSTSISAQPVPWMDNPKARQITKDFLVRYEETLISSRCPPAVVARVKAILGGMETLHPTGPSR